MSRPIPDHGTPARYRGNSSRPGCRCTPCRRAAVREDALCTLERLSGNPRRVPAAPAWRHVEQLRARGFSDAEIARAANLDSPTLLSRLATQQRVGRDRAQRILAVPLDYEPPCQEFVPAIGVIRRVRALFSLGHSGPVIADRAGTDRQRMARLAHAQQVTVHVGLDRAIRRIYPELSTVRGTSTKAVRLAARNNWAGPLAWGDDIDDPAATPGGLMLNRRGAAEERLTEMWLLASAGATPPQIAARTGIPEKTVRDRLRRKFPHLYLQLTA